VTSTLNVQFLPDGTSQVNITVVNLKYSTYELGAEIGLKLAKVLSEVKEPVIVQEKSLPHTLEKLYSGGSGSITTLPLQSPSLSPSPQPEPNVKRLANIWSAKELGAIKNIADKQNAVAAYRLAVPNSIRTDTAIEQRWYDICRKKQKREVKTVTTHFPATSQAVSQAASQSTTSQSASIKPGMKVKDVRGNGISKGHTGIVKRINEKTGDILIQFDTGLVWVPKENCDVDVM